MNCQTGHRLAALVGGLVATALCPRVHAQQPAYPAAGAPTAPSRALETGGLAPPSSSPQAAGQAQVARQLEDAERNDAGRGLEFVWLNATAGFEFASLDAVSGDNLLGAGVDSSAGGLSLGATAGLRIVFLTAGASLRVVKAPDWDLWTIGGRLGLHFPMGSWEPSAAVELGYATLPGESTGGFNARLAGGLDWYLNPLLSVGAAADASLLVLSADRPSAATGETETHNAVGISAGVSAVVGLHF